MKIEIIKDTREKEGKGWTWEPEEEAKNGIKIVGTIDQVLDAGDYSIKGFEDQIRIERKQNFSELFGNMTPVANRERFERELEKLRNVPYRYLLIEGTITSDLLGMTVPQFFKSPPSSALMRWLIGLQMDYDINFIPVGDSGKKFARYIFEEFIKRVK